ncbi:MAG: hypothetical protein AVDCRST_MAG85-2883, partial [uncultured Solirubrobacteraceae bacterium]
VRPARPGLPARAALRGRSRRDRGRPRAGPAGLAVGRAPRAAGVGRHRR